MVAIRDVFDSQTTQIVELNQLDHGSDHLVNKSQQQYDKLKIPTVMAFSQIAFC
jgi:hypothetical protein